MSQTRRYQNTKSMQMVCNPATGLLYHVPYAEREYVDRTGVLDDSTTVMLPDDVFRMLAQITRDGHDPKMRDAVVAAAYGVKA